MSGLDRASGLGDHRVVSCKVSELLSRVVELADGRRSTEEIARRLTETTKWEVADEDVARIIERKLAPVGLVEHPDWLDATASARAPSPLLVNARLRIIGPGPIERVARVGQHLFWPPALSALLGLIVASQLWLFTIGQPGVVMQRLASTPLSLPLLVGLLLLAGAVHELGHAAAIRYGGARARAMGIGWYLVVPIFYTDVTESYRLSRGGRVRTDLGGLYFHLLVAAAFVGIHAATGYDAFLVAALLIDLDVARQLIPFIRLDGYWVLADLTGIPDLFTHAAPRLRRLFGKRSDGPAPPALRPRVRRIFAAYLALTVPIIVGLFGYVIWHAPAVVSRASAAVASRTDLLADASSAESSARDCSRPWRCCSSRSHHGLHVLRRRPGQVRLGDGAAARRDLVIAGRGPGLALTRPRRSRSPTRSPSTWSSSNATRARTPEAASTRAGA